MLFPRLKPESPNWLHLDALRFVAAAGIVWLHSHSYFFPPAVRASVQARTNNLDAFVDLFFVISGFIITALYGGRIARMGDYQRFLRLRVARLMPLHLLVLVITIVAIKTGLAMGLPMKNVPDFSAACIAHNALLLNAFFPCGNGTVITLFSWTIGIEFALYTLFPLLALAAGGWRLALVAGSFAASQLVEPAGGFGVEPMLRGVAAFTFGMALFEWRGTIGRWSPRPALLPLALLALIVAMHIGLPRVAIMPAVFAIAALAVALDQRGEATRPVRALAPFGQLTYATYMWHTLFIMILLSGLGDKLLKLPPAAMVVLGLVTYAAILGWSYALWRWFEMPMRRMIAGSGKAGKDRRLALRQGESDRVQS